MSSARLQKGSSCLSPSTSGPAEFTKTSPLTLSLEVSLATLAIRELYPPRLLPTRTTGSCAAMGNGHSAIKQGSYAGKMRGTLGVFMLGLDTGIGRP
eukprot:6122512-Pyramimonas_sp.AAC.3